MKVCLNPLDKNKKKGGIERSAGFFCIWTCFCKLGKFCLFLSKLVSIFAFGGMRIENSGFGFSCMCLAHQRAQPVLFWHLISGISYCRFGFKM